MKENTIATRGRIAFTIIILAFVWMNAHWSIGLILSLMSIRMEIEDSRRRNG